MDMMEVIQRLHDAMRVEDIKLIPDKIINLISDLESEEEKYEEWLCSEYEKTRWDDIPIPPIQVQGRSYI